LQPDSNSPIGHHHQWFYFSIRNGQPGHLYHFEIVNMVKDSSSYERGMQLAFYSQKQQCWSRRGSSIQWFPNPYRNGESKTFHSLAWTMTLPFANDLVYLSYFFPYTYSQLQVCYTNEKMHILIS
jgi:hypothetical protein